MELSTVVSECDKPILDTPKQGTLEYLFKDYDGGSFQAELFDLGEPVGYEEW